MTAKTPVAESAAAATASNRWPALIVLCAGLLMVILDGTVVTVALPAIQRDLGFAPAGLTWVVGAYLIPFGGLLLLSGRVGDLVGRRKVFLAGVLLFTVASALCGLAVGPQMLIAARFLQGIGGAIASSVILGMIVGLFPGGPERARAIGVYSFVGAAGAAIGLLAGGVLTQVLSWHWVFLVNVPIGAVTVLAALRVLSPDRVRAVSGSKDAIGAGLLISALMLTVYTITEVPGSGWTSWTTIVGGMLCVLLLAAFVSRERFTREPLLALSVLCSRFVWGANLVQFLMVGALFAFPFLVGLYLQVVLGYGAAQTGLAFLPITLAIGLFSLVVTPRLLVRWSGRSVVVAGLALIGVGLALLARVPVDADYVSQILPATLVMGIGGGLTLPGVATLGMSAASDADAGLASGLLNTTQQIGGAMGLAVLSSLAAARTESASAAGQAAAEALTDGYRLAFTVGASIVAIALVFAVFALRPATASSSGAGRTESLGRN